jgi:hypothetical protein
MKTPSSSMTGFSFLRFDDGNGKAEAACSICFRAGADYLQEAAIDHELQKVPHRLAAGQENADGCG